MRFCIQFFVAFMLHAMAKWGAVTSFSLTGAPVGSYSRKQRQRQPGHSAIVRTTTATSKWKALAATSKEEEIRELEEKLQRLKEEQVSSDTVTAKQDVEETETAVQLNDEAVYTELLTEQWKEEEDEASSSGGGIMKSALAAVGLLVGLAFFSQVPMGREELSRYSTLSAPSSTQIDLGDLNRARRGGDV